MKIRLPRHGVDSAFPSHEDHCDEASDEELFMELGCLIVSGAPANELATVRKVLVKRGHAETVLEIIQSLDAVRHPRGLDNRPPQHPNIKES